MLDLKLVTMKAAPLFDIQRIGCPIAAPGPAAYNKHADHWHRDGLKKFRAAYGDMAQWSVRIGYGGKEETFSYGMAWDWVLSGPFADLSLGTCWNVLSLMRALERGHLESSKQKWAGNCQPIKRAKKTPTRCVASLDMT